MPAYTRRLLLFLGIRRRSRRFLVDEYKTICGEYKEPVTAAEISMEKNPVTAAEISMEKNPGLEVGAV